MKRKNYKIEFLNLMFHADQLINNMAAFNETNNLTYATHAKYHLKTIKKIINDNRSIHEKNTIG